MQVQESCFTGYKQKADIKKHQKLPLKCPYIPSKCNPTSQREICTTLSVPPEPTALMEQSRPACDPSAHRGWHPSPS